LSFDWKNLWDVASQIEAIWGWAEFVFFVLTYISYLAYSYYRAGSFLSRVLLEPGAGLRRGGRKMWLLARADAGLLFGRHASRFSAARRLAELEILAPAEKRPNRNDYSRAELDGYVKDLNAWRKHRSEREAGLITSLQAELRGPSSHFETSGFDLLGRCIEGVSSLLKGSKSSATYEPPHLKSFSHLDENRDAIRRYFLTLKDMDPKAELRFLSETKIDIGYVAPLILLTGILNRFDEDGGWKHILENYRSLVADDEPYSIETRELRSFLFNCWLLWGPSISLCSCSAWRCPAEANASYLLQYGYGDENQSIGVFWRSDSAPDEMESNQLLLPLRSEPDTVDPRIGILATARLAVPAVLRGHFRWGPDYRPDQICRAQQQVRGDPEEPNSRGGRVVLECASNRGLIANRSTLSSNYYSAYIWVIFVICDERGRLFYPNANDAWKNLLCFFEHGNIADATTFQALKEYLIAKVNNSLSEILERERILGKPIKIVYACALDDTNCSAEGKTLFPPSSHERVEPCASLSESDRTRLENTLSTKKERIVDILAEQILTTDISGKPVHPVLAEAVASGHLILPVIANADELDWGEVNFSSCSLPQIVDDFYHALGQPGT